MKKAVVTVVVLVFLGAMAVLGWKVWEKVEEARGKETGKRERGKDTVVAVEVTPVRKTTIRDVARFTGSLQPRAQFIVAPKVAGRLVRLLVDIGDKVRRNQQVAILDDAEYAQAVEEMRAQLEVAQALVNEAKSALEIGKREYERFERMRQKGVTSEALYDGALAKYHSQSAKLKVTEAQLIQKQAALKAAEIRLSYTRISTAGEEGDADRVVGERFVDEGAMLRANDPIVSVLDIDTLIAVIHVIERDYPKIRMGQEAQVTTDAYPDRTFTGKIVRIAPLLMEKARQARVEVSIANEGRLLKPGMFVRLHVEIDRHENATVVPASALTRRNKQRGVFIADLEKMTTRFVPLKIGITSDDVVEVLAPEISGSVVSIGQHLLGEDSTIVLPESKPTAEGADEKKSTAPAGGKS